MTAPAGSRRPVAVVTGGGTGMGRAIAADLAIDHDVVIVGRRVEPLQDVAADLGGTVSIFAADVSSIDAVEALTAHVLATRGRIDVVVNCAGAAPPQVRVTSDLREAYSVWNEQISLNATSQFLVCHATARHLPRGGRIVNVSSEAVSTGSMTAGLATYVAAKAAVHGLTLALARELSPAGITVNCVVPGYIEETGLSAGFNEEVRARQVSRNLVGIPGTVAHIAHTVRYLVDPAAEFVTGQFLQVNGGSTLGR